LVSGRNQVYTMCEHLFCVSCLLKWCKQCNEQDHDVPTCPLCRDPLYNNNEGEAEVEDEDEAEHEVEDEDEDEDEAEDEEESTRRQPTFISDVFIYRNAVYIRA